MTHIRDKLVEAMDELRERRNGGEHLHLILAEVALEHGVAEAGLRQKAEASWGAPLETDRERHQAYFDFLKSKKEVNDRAKDAARLLWEHWAEYIEKYSASGIDWKRDIARIVDKSGIDDPTLKALANETFFDELMRLIARQKAGLWNAPNR